MPRRLLPGRAAIGDAGFGSESCRQMSTFSSAVALCVMLAHHRGMPEHDLSLATLSVSQARLMLLAAQGLLHKPSARPTPASTLAAIERMQLLQIDTIHVVARSPYLVLFSRLGHYAPSWLDDLLATGEIFEVWAHEACFASSRDFALHRAHRERGARSFHWSHKHALRMHEQQRDGMDRLLDHIRAVGPVKASDFERKEPALTGWWSWKDEKRWLEALFALGDLMVLRRERFQRVYELSERVIATHSIDAKSQPAPEEMSRELILRSVRALGIAQARWIADYYRTGRKHKDSDLDALVAGGDMLRVAVSDWDAPAYVHHDDAGLLEQALTGKLRATHTTVLSPFDPLIWDRDRARTMFGFEYTIECYTPEAKRRFGYFVLPILHRGRLIGRLDAKAHRVDGIFEIKKLFLESAVEVTDALATSVAQALRDCAQWHATPEVAVRATEPRAFAAILRKALARTPGSS